MMKRLSLGLILLFGSIAVTPAALAQSDSARVDQLFLIASSGEVRFRDRVEPAKDSLIAMGETAARWLARKMPATDARERHTLAGLFEKIGRVATPYLLPYLDSAGEYMPKNAARCLGVIKDSTATPALIATLGNDLYAVRSQVATALGQIADRRAVNPLLDLLPREPDSDVRKSITVALGRIGDPAAAEALVDALADPFFGVRQSATEALTKLDTPPTDRLLTAVIADSGVARHGAIVALGACDDPRARQKLVSLLSDGDALVRGFTVEALAVNPDADVRARVLSLETSETDPFVLAQINRFKAKTEK